MQIVQKDAEILGLKEHILKNKLKEIEDAKEAENSGTQEEGDEEGDSSEEG